MDVTRRVRFIHSGLSFLLGLSGTIIGGLTAAGSASAQEVPGTTTMPQSKVFSPALAPPALQTPDASPSTGQTPAPPFQIKLGFSSEEKATDNAATTGVAPKADLISSVTPTTAVTYKTKKLDLGVNYELGYDKYAFSPNLGGLHRDGLGVADATLIDHTLFLDARFSDTLQSVNPAGPATADNRLTKTNQTQVTTLSVTPQLEQRLGAWAIGSLSYGHDETINQPMDSSQTVAPVGTLSGTHTDIGKIELRNGEAFSYLLWDYTGETIQQFQNNQALYQNTHIVGAEYRLTTIIGLLTEGGLDDIRGYQIDSHAVSGVFYSAGLHWAPGSNTDVRVGWGRRYGGNDLYILGEYRFGAMTVLRLSSQTNLTTDAMSFIESLNAVQRDANGTFIDPFSGGAANPSAPLFTRSNAVYRQRTSSAVLTHTRARDTVSLTGSLAEQTVISGSIASQSTLPGTTPGTASTSLMLDLEWTHELSPRANLALTASSDEVIESNSPMGKSQRYRAGLAWNYQISTTVTASVSYNFVDSASTPAATVRENIMLVGITKRL